MSYFDLLAGLSDREMVRRWLGADFSGAEEVVGERIARYRSAAADGATVLEAMLEAVRYEPARVPVAVVSSATRSEVETVLAAAGVLASVQAVVTIEETAGASRNRSCTSAHGSGSLRSRRPSTR